jgi:DNA-binding beta-propeller fold protein YncE
VKHAAFATAAVAAMSAIATAAADERPLEFTKLWTHSHTGTPGQVSEIPAFDSKTNTIWVAGVVGVDVLNAATGALVAHIDVTPWGAVNSVAIFNGLAALAIEAAPDRRAPGKVVFFDTRTRALATGISEVTVGPLPDMLTFTHDGTKLLVANEGTPNAAADEDYETPDPLGSVSIIDMATRSVIATPGFAGVPQAGTNTTLYRLDRVLPKPR